MKTTSRTITLWLIDSTDHDQAMGRYYAIISPDERQRDRQRVITYGVLRLLLADALNTQAHTLQLKRNQYGKPTLEGGPAFSIAYTERYSLLAIGECAAVGVDIERHRRVPDDLLRGVVTPQEERWLKSLPAHQQKKATFDLWVQKEAVYKAQGGGLTHSAYESNPAYHTELVEVRQGWSAAVAYRGSIDHIQVREYPCVS
jgi:phosphopantetheinyl transferase